MAEPAELNKFQRIVEERRVQLGLSWDNFGRAAGMSGSTLRKIVKGPHPGEWPTPKEEQLHAIARATGYPFEYLVGLVGEVKGFTVTDRFTPRQLLLMVAAGRLDEHVQDAVQLLVDALGQAPHPSDPADRKGGDGLSQTG